MAKTRVTHSSIPVVTGLAGEVAASELVKALNNRIRRSVLRFLLSTTPASSNEIRREMPASVGSKLGFHLGILVSTGAVVTARKTVGYRERLYAPSEAIQAPWILVVLKLTELED